MAGEPDAGAVSTICPGGGRRGGTELTFGHKREITPFIWYCSDNLNLSHRLREALMRYRTFGRQTGLRVSEYVLGTANFGSAPAQPGRGLHGDLRRLRHRWRHHVRRPNLYQTDRPNPSSASSSGRDRDDYAVITKYSGTRQDRLRPGTTGNSRKTMIRSLEASLRRLEHRLRGRVHAALPRRHHPDRRRSWPASRT